MPEPTDQREPCVQCGAEDHDHFNCPCNCLRDTNADCPVHSIQRLQSHRPLLTVKMIKENGKRALARGAVNLKGTGRI